MTPDDPRYWLQDTQTEYGSSRIMAYERCPREHWLRYMRGVESVRRPRALGTGSLVHAALAYARHGRMIGRDLSWLSVVDVAGAMDPDLTPQQQAEAYRLLGAYELQYGHASGFPLDDHRVRVLGVEQAFEVDVGAPVPFTGRADCVVDIAGTVIVIDTKTRGQKIPADRDEYARQLATRPQFPGLVAGVRQLYGLDYNPPILLDAIIKTKVPRMDRLGIEVDPRQMERWRVGMRSTLQQIFVGSSGRNPRLTSCAPEIGSPCEFFQWCHGTDEERERNYRLRAAKEEQ